MNVVSLKTLPGKPNWDKTMVKEMSTTRIFLPLIKTLLDISETMHSNLISQLFKYWCWQSLVNKFTRLSLECVFERLSHHFVEDHVWKRLLVKYALSDLLWLYHPSIELYIIFVYGGWNIWLGDWSFQFYWSSSFLLKENHTSSMCWVTCFVSFLS